MAKKPFCTVAIRDAETAAYIYTVLYMAWPGESGFKRTIEEQLNRGTHFPGGSNAARGLDFGPTSGRGDVMKDLSAALNVAGINSTCAPWLEPKAPTEIDGSPVECSGGGVKVGCAFVSLPALKCLVEKCEEAGE